MDQQARMPASISAVAGPGDDTQFRIFAESMSNLAWIATADGWLYWYNQRWYEYTGTTPEQMEGWGWQSVHDPVQLPLVLERWQSSIATGEPFEMTFPLRSVSGEFRPFLTRGIPFKDDRGNVLRWFGTNTDISQETQVAAALRQSEERFRTAIKASSDILWTNDAAGKMQGEQVAWSAFTGQTFEQYHDYGWASAVHPDDVQSTIEAWEQCVREHCLFSFEHRVRRHDGVYRLCTIRALPILNDDDSVREWVGVHTDVTEERETQRTLRETFAALKQQQELVEAAQVASNVGFWRLYPATGDCFFSAGSRHLLGLPPTGEINLQQAIARVHPDDVHRIQEALQTALITGHYRIEFRTLPRPTEESRWLLGAASLVSPPHDSPLSGAPYFVGMNLDITQQKRSAEALIRSEKLAVAGRLAASIAHEINNPLEALTNLLYLLLQTPLNPEQRQYALIMRGELDRVSQISTHTLRFHRQSTSATEISIPDLLDSVLALHEGRLRNASVTVERRLRSTHQIFGFDGDLRQVLANLVGNALDAMHGVEGTRKLYLRTSNARSSKTRQAGVRVTIADTGSGMSTSTAARIFDAFFTTKGDTGTGLGLWVSAEIVTKHNGSLHLRTSQRPTRHGTVFQLFLPLTTTSPKR